MMTLRDVRLSLKDRNLSYVASKIGMTRQQLWRIASGSNDNPTQKTLEKISNYLEAENEDDRHQG